VAADEQQAFLEAVQELRVLTAEVRRDLGTQELELKEFVMLIKQTQSEVDRLTPSRNDTSKRLREMENNIEHYSRSDILGIADAAAQSQMRMFMMESQLEQLQYKQKAVEQTRRNLLRFAALVDQLPTPATDSQTAGDDFGRSTKEVIAQIIQAEEDERQRSAVAIHDGSAQQLTNLVLRIQLCQRLMESDPERGRQELQELQVAMAVALQESRRLIHELRPFAIEELGVYASLRRYVQAVADRGVRIDLRISGNEARLVPSLELALFRIVQEALSNAVRHAQAKTVRAIVEGDSHAFRATIEDDGVGFDPPTGVQAARARHQYGLAVLYERAALVGGTLSIDSRLGKGTRVKIEAPLG
jgi:two-component system, NarL family, sensor histidine kinase DegS